MSRIADALRPPRQAEITPPQGFADPDWPSNRFFSQLNRSIASHTRSQFLSTLEEMSNDGALADKALLRLARDASATPIKLDAPSRTERIAMDMLDTIGYQDIREQLIYLALRDGDLFLQKIYQQSTNPKRIAFISDVKVMPVRTMLRNTNEVDEFASDSVAFVQVSDISQGLASDIKIPFHKSKILHARMDHLLSDFFPYGRSIWRSAARIFNMAVMNIEDVAISRHRSSQDVIWHFVGKHAEGRVTDGLIKRYAKNIADQYSSNTTQMFVDGKSEVVQMGGPKSVMATIDDVQLIFSVLSVALEYPLDLLSLSTNKGSGGEELFRKETILKRAIESIIERENRHILRPLIDTELRLAGNNNDYRITTKPLSFEDATKKSKRGLTEYEKGVKSFRSFHLENNPETSPEEERKRLLEDAAFWEEVAEDYPNYFKMLGGGGGGVPDTGQRGSTEDPENQQVRTVPGELGTDDRSEADADD